ncbi:hypothetical protein [Paenibacillus thiaminolyticus]|uniref:hypothetical protein n=1 Tax=Paenibacillus thiaminolyticus TaxID=49283 RepID=UPI002542F82C|nr:hypothetical protein [Paenibacillus thiaminolyticus]WII39504.1 hypothetical protein O0V01_10600 [Paenibacillus thiaminolyticus]
MSTWQGRDLVVKEMTLDELKDVMSKEDVRRLEIKLQQGEILKSIITKSEHFYSFEFLIKTKYGRMLIAGYYGPYGITYICDATRLGEIIKRSYNANSWKSLATKCFCCAPNSFQDVSASIGPKGPPPPPFGGGSYK